MLRKLRPFRKPAPLRAGPKAFPKPEWPPIQDLDGIDVVGKRRDGGVDLVIVASQPLDDSRETLESLQKKVGTYLHTLFLEAFQEELGHPPLSQTAILVSCEFPVHPAAMKVIEECKALAASKGVRLELRSSRSR